MTFSSNQLNLAAGPQGPNDPSPWGVVPKQGGGNKGGGGDAGKKSPAVSQWEDIFSKHNIQVVLQDSYLEFVFCFYVVAINICCFSVQANLSDQFPIENEAELLTIILSLHAIAKNGELIFSLFLSLYLSTVFIWENETNYHHLDRQPNPWNHFCIQMCKWFGVKEKRPPVSIPLNTWCSPCPLSLPRPVHPVPMGILLLL